jgi:biopolymer transport protein ExbB
MDPSTKMQNEVTAQFRVWRFPMHDRISAGHLAAVRWPVSLATGCAVAIALAIGGTSAAWAANAAGPEPLKKQEKSAGGSEKPAPAKPTAEKPSAEKPAAAVGEKPPADKGGTKQLPPGAKELELPKNAGKDARDKAATEKPVREKAAADKSSDEKIGAEESPAQRESKESVLVWLYRSMGLRYVIIFLGVTFNEIALVVMILLGLRRKCICPLSLAKDFEAKLNKKQYQEAYDAAKQDNSFLGKVLAAGMANLSEGHESALEAMHEVGEEQNMRLEQRNGHIALIAQIGPMLGLLATVDGIVRAFAVIAGKDVTPKPSELAQGIGIALVNTVVGLWLAIPSIVFYHIIRNRLTRLVLEVGVISSRLMKRFSNVSVAVKKT